MKHKSFLAVLVAGLTCLPFLSYGNWDHDNWDHLNTLRQRAEQGNAEAQLFLGEAYFFGDNVPENYRAAVRRFLPSYEKAPFRLAEQDYKEAVKWFRLAAEKGNADAQFFLGQSYFFGDGVSQDSTEAVKWFRLAAEQGLAEAQFSLGLACVEDKESIKWWRLAAAQGNANAQYCLGHAYSKGGGVPKDHIKAFQWYRKADVQGHSGAHTALKHFYLLCLGGTAGVVLLFVLIRWRTRILLKLTRGWRFLYSMPMRTKKVALSEWQQKAEHGDAKAQNRLGCYYSVGDGVPKDDKEAVKWFRRAAEQGNAEAQSNLAGCYSKGKGVSEDYIEAVKWWRLAAEQGNGDAQYKLTAFYGNYGELQNETEALKWWRLAAEQGDARAQINLGSRYDEGKGVPQDYKEALKWYRLAAEQGFAEAQVALGGFYKEGKGVSQDYAQAYAWYNVAATQGDKKAAELRAAILKTMTPEQIEEGQRLSREYAEKFVKQSTK
jgi:TPR repeat protein